MIFEEVRAGGDFEGATVIFGAADDRQGSVEFLIADDNAEMAKIVAENLANALPPVGENAEARFQIEIEGVQIGRASCRERV